MRHHQGHLPHVWHGRTIQDSQDRMGCPWRVVCVDGVGNTFDFTFRSIGNRTGDTERTASHSRIERRGDDPIGRIGNGIRGHGNRAFPVCGSVYAYRNRGIFGKFDGSPCVEMVRRKFGHGMDRISRIAIGIGNIHIPTSSHKVGQIRSNDHHQTSDVPKFGKRTFDKFHILIYTDWRII